MSKLMHDYSDKMINKSLLGWTKLHSGLIVLENCNTVLRKDYRNMKGKVKLISGGKIENELIYTGFVGSGMLTAAILGNTFCAPPIDDILKVIEQVGCDNSAGILLIIQNYAEYTINFTSAKLRAEEKGHIVKIITVNSISHYFESATKEPNFLPIIFVYKIAGAMSEEGKSMNEIYSVCNSIANSGEIALLKIDYESIMNKEYKSEIFLSLAKQVFEPMIKILNLGSDQSNICTYETNKFHAGHEIAIIINNFGYSQMETNTFVLEFFRQIEAYDLNIKRIYIKSLVTNAKGFYICLLNLSFTTELIKYLDFPTYAPAWPKVLTSEIMAIEDNNTAQLVTSVKHCKNVNVYDVHIQGPITSHETSQLLLSVISMACEAIIACTKQLNKMDQQFGNGDCGTNLARGANAIQNAIQQNKILGINVCKTFIQISQIIERTVGGLQGGLYSLFFYNVAKTFSEYENHEEITVAMWLHALSEANKTIEQLGISPGNDQILLTVLTAVQKDLKDALNRNLNPIEAFGTIVKSAENFAINTLHAQCFNMKGCEEFKYPNPQAHAVGIWMRAAYEVTKLKLNYYTK